MEWWHALKMPPTFWPCLPNQDGDSPAQRALYAELDKALRGRVPLDFKNLGGIIIASRHSRSGPRIEDQVLHDGPRWGSRLHQRNSAGAAFSIVRSGAEHRG